ncbi:hypothetical protein GSI_10456 [Ganoderma sinense ZZ0214-1]|uniref:Uncharacterized protein n=1 Tax=Ganoderma sinense ZZ0214-1 TaxID=1077348 RepID=A0A2G8S0L1_9APHY|nr:hypothetical protein GSI_10456 [Ganoderma sinense ZZ0214-1]
MAKNGSSDGVHKIANEREENCEHANEEVRVTPADSHYDSTDEYQQKEQLRELCVTIDGTSGFIWKTQFSTPGDKNFPDGGTPSVQVVTCPLNTSIPMAEQLGRLVHLVKLHSQLMVEFRRWLECRHLLTTI